MNTLITPSGSQFYDTSGSGCHCIVALRMYLYILSKFKFAVYVEIEVGSDNKLSAAVGIRDTILC